MRLPRLASGHWWTSYAATCQTCSSRPALISLRGGVPGKRRAFKQSTGYQGRTKGNRPRRARQSGRPSNSKQKRSTRDSTAAQLEVLRARGQVRQTQKQKEPLSADVIGAATLRLQRLRSSCRSGRWTCMEISSLGQGLQRNSRPRHHRGRGAAHGLFVGVNAGKRCCSTPAVPRWYFATWRRGPRQACAVSILAELGSRSRQ